MLYHLRYHERRYGDLATRVDAIFVPEIRNPFTPKMKFHDAHLLPVRLSAARMQIYEAHAV